MLHFDWSYFIYVGPFMLLSLWAGWKVKSAFSKWDQVRNSSGYTGADVARKILDSQGLYHVKVERVPGELTDHYDPGSKTLRLSDSTYDSSSVAAAGVAAHEAGHAIQDKVQYSMLTFRSTIVQMAGFSSNASWIMIFAGFAMMTFLRSSLGYYIAVAGVALFAIVVLFQLITVPVELDASRRAKEVLQGMGIQQSGTGSGVAEVLNAAAWTYVAAAGTALATLLYYALQLAGFNRGQDGE
ncbi:MAG: zinc metallopeptidase [Leptospirales bacterium]|nr:zinc metallopeptidase [Leptospirales bacterium]